MLEEHLKYVILFLIAAILLLALIIIHLMLKVKGIQRRYRKMFIRREGVDLGEAMRHCVEAVDRLDQKYRDTEKLVRELEHLMNYAVMGVGLERYNAFNDTGSDLSFSLALLNKKNKGVIVSSLFGRDETRVYAKEINEGESTYRLSDEEMRALKRAKSEIGKVGD